MMKRVMVEEDLKSEDMNKKEEKGGEDVDLFQKEISNLPEEAKSKLLAKKGVVDDFIKIVSEKAGEKSMGFYLKPVFERGQDGKTYPNFDKLDLHFLLDDFEKPITNFDARFLLGDEFDNYLVEEKGKDEQGQPILIYKLRADSDIVFYGSSISILRENCFDSIYDDLRVLGSSFVVEDSRGFISALKTIDIHRNMLLQKFEKYVVVYAGAGSWLRGEKSNDFDVFVVVDDTDVKRMPRLQVKDQLSKIIWQMAQDVAQMTGIRVHAQIYLLTDFWDALKDAHPVMFTFLRDGVPFYDRGLYNSWKELLKLGKIKPSPEAIDMHMNVANQLVDRANKTLADIVMNDIYYAVLNPAQAILMLKGFNPTTPKETVAMFKDVLLSKEKLVSKKDVSILENTVSMFKKIEHNKDMKIKGKDVDSMLLDAEEFLKNMKKIFEEVTQQRSNDSVLSAYNELINQIRTLPNYSEISADEILDTFEKEYVESGRLSSFVTEAMVSIRKAKKDYDENNLTQTEVNSVLKDIRNVLAEIKDYRDRNILSELNKKRIPLNYSSGMVAELFNYAGTIYLNVSGTVYEYRADGFEETSKKDDEFKHPSEYGSVKLSEDLLQKVRDVLGVDEIYF